MAMITEIRRKLPLLKSRETEDAPLGASVVEICIDDIIPNRSQPRSAFNQNAIVRLADSIRRYGILQPLTVRKVLLPIEATKNAPLGQKNAVIYELVAGERRLRAAKMLGLKTVPCILADVDDEVSAELALVENMLRENLGFFEQAVAFSALSEKYGLTQEEIAQKMSLSQSAVANKIRLLKLSPEERTMIVNAELTERHARSFLRITSKTLRQQAISHVIKDKLNVLETEKYVAELLGSDAVKQKKKQETKKPISLTSSQLVCNNIDRYVQKLCSFSKLVSVDKKEVDGDTVITLTVKSGDAQQVVDV